MAGDTVVWDVEAFEHPDLGSFSPADSWNLTYELVATDQRLTASAVVTDGRWRTTLTASQTTALKSSATDVETVHWTGRATKGGESYSVRSGALLLYPDPATTASYESHNAIMVRRIRAALETADAGGVVSYSIGNRAVTRDRSAALRELAAYEARLWREQHPGELGPAVQMRFARAR